MNACCIVKAVLAMVAAAVLTGGLAGCDSSQSGEYHSYPQQDAVGTAPDAASSSVQGAVAEVEKPAAAPADTPPVETPPAAGLRESAQPAADKPEAPVTPPADTAVATAGPAGETKEPVANAAASLEAAGTPPATGAAPQATPDPQAAASTPVPAGPDPAAQAAVGSAASASRGAQPGSPAPAAADPAAPRKVELLVKKRDFKVEGPDNAIRVSYDDIDLLKVLNMEPVTPDAPNLMPDWLKALDGRRIRIRGFMYPNELESGIEHFILARDNQICCFGRNPKIYDVFWIHVREGKTTDYILGRPFDVVGVFHIQPIVEEDKLYQLYVMDDAVVIE